MTNPESIEPTDAPDRTRTAARPSADPGGDLPPFGHRAEVFAARERDWRCGAVVYQVLVDRFAPALDLPAKRALYAEPRRLREWHERPAAGEYLAEHRVWSHELDFWGGDLASLRARLDHVRQLGADVLYLNPVCLAWTNHKYDALDYREVSPEFGTRADVTALADALHAHGMKLVLDGVFNHMGRQSAAFQGALADPDGPWREWFVWADDAPGGARCWWRAENLPELHLENPAVRADLWGDPGSVVRGWLRDGADGWRLDVAFDIGPRWLAELTAAAHAEKPGSLVVGEIANYPAGWIPAVDATMLFVLRRLILKLVDGALEPEAFGRMVARLVDDVGIEPLLRCWTYLDNHDTPRLATAVPDERAQRVAQVLQFTLPGSPTLYYGSEVGMTGGDDPEMRAPMRWDLIDAGHPTVAWTQRLTALRREHRALRVGDWRAVTAQRVFAFERLTDRAADTVLVVVNPAREPVTDTLLVADGRLMDDTALVEVLGQRDGEPPLRLHAALLTLTVPAQTAWVLKAQTAAVGGYSNYKRVP